MRIADTMKVYGRIAALAGAAIIALTISAAGTVSAAGDEAVPGTSVVPATGGASAAAAETAAPAKPAHAKHHAPRAVRAPEVEPASARLQLLQNGWAYVGPAKSSGKVQQVTAGKYVAVTGSTRYYLRVKLKSGKTAYVEQSIVELTKPIDKVWRLHHNAAVRDQPNRWAKKVSEVHNGHDVHAIGMALNYVKIRMKSGVEGYIPASALE